MEIASVKPKRRQASIVCTGRHLPKMSAAKAINTRPEVIFRVNSDAWPIERYAPPIPARMPDKRTPAYLIRATGTPAASAASGFSPTERSRKPKGVLYNTYQLIGTIGKAIMMGVVEISGSLPIGGVAPEDKKNAPLRNPGTPIINIFRAVRSEEH